MSIQIPIRVNGHAVSVPAGTTVAAAVMAAGETAFRRSARGEPRGPLCGMGICFECRVTIDGVPHSRSCQTVCRPEMEIRTEGPLLPCGDSLPTRDCLPTRDGLLPTRDRPLPSRDCKGAVPARYPTTESGYDVVVVGAGPAGIAAACAARESGLSVAVVDDNPAAGGQIWRGGIPSPWRERFRQEVIADTRVVGLIEPGVLLAESPADALALRYRKLILAPGARELLLPFPGWTLPNVLAAGGLQALVKGGLPIEDKRVVVAGTGPLLPAVAVLLRRRGARVRGFFGQRYSRCRLAAAEGDGKLEAVVLRRGRKTWREPCDYLACSFGLVANLELPLLMGCALQNGSAAVSEYQETSIAGIYYAGQTGGVGLALAEGEIAGYACAGRTLDARRHFGARARARWFQAALDWAFPLRDELRSLATPETIVCRCEDVALGALAQHKGWRSAKLETRCGMGPCQGRVCGAAIEYLLGWKSESVRPPIFPVRAETLAAIHWKK